MTYKIFISKTFQKKYKNLEPKDQPYVKNSLNGLKIDPYNPRVKCDIKQLKNTKPRKYRLRVGNLRIIYIVDGKIIKIIDLIKRETGYSNIE